MTDCEFCRTSPNHGEKVCVSTAEARECGWMCKSDWVRWEEAHKTDWRPIETAPHETYVLLGWWDDGEWNCQTGMATHGWRRNGVSTMSQHGQATHWQALPAAPPRC